jgi:predicted acetyltransferase
MITLEAPRLTLVSSFIDFFEEMRRNGETIWEEATIKAGETHQDFIDRLRRGETHPAPGLVPSSTCWACEGDVVVGRIALRHSLNEFLKEFGGHIGYEVRPSARRRGIAKEMLRQLLLRPETRQISRLLLTCSPTNSASIKTIEANGGVFEKTAYLPRVQRDTSYYWIESSR